MLFLLFLFIHFLSVDADDKYCLKQQTIFESVSEADAVGVEFRRILPVLVKMWTFRLGPGTNKENEMPDNHERFNILGPIGPLCKTPLEIFGLDKASGGQKGDEEKRICNLSYLQSSDESGKCVIFSIGNNHKWGFEEDIYEKTKCTVETFDCTCNATVPAAIASRVRFHHVCLGDKTETKNDLNYVTWEGLLELTGITRPPTFLKMDIEGYEFPVMRSIIDSNINTPLQIAMEVHARRWEHGRTKFNYATNALELNSFVSYLREFGGYYMV